MCIKPGGEYVHIHAFAQVLCKKVKKPLIVMVSGGGNRGGRGEVRGWGQDGKKISLFTV